MVRLGLRCAGWLGLLSLLAGALAAAEAPNGGGTPHPPIPIRFTLSQPGLVTLVIDDSTGRRVRNLVSETPFPAGEHVVWWDGLDDKGRIQTSINCNFQVVPGLVEPGRYRVRGLVRPPIHLRYEFTVYNPGRPPWATADPASEWLANHTPPSGVLFIPEEETRGSPAGFTRGGQVLVCSHVAEGGSGLAWLDLDGRKLRGQHWIGGVWTGATHMARDTGPDRVPGVYAYTGAAWAAGAGGGFDGPRSELRLAELLTRDARAAAPRDPRFGRGDDRPLLVPFSPYQGVLPPGVEKLGQPGEDTRYAFPDPERAVLGGLAVHNARLVASLTKMHQLLWVDARARKILGTVPVPDPRGVAFDAKGRLLVLSGRRLLRYVVGANPLQLADPETVVGAGLEDPIGITLDRAGRIYISDRGRSNQVKVFSPQGRFVRAIGHPGLPRLGPYDPRLMHQPNGITVDSRDRLWVAETDFVPKRVSVWTLDGRFVKAFYGPMEYGGGGCLDPVDPSRFYYSGMEFRLDWRTGASWPTAIYYYPDQDPLGLPSQFRSRAPETALTVRGRRYLTDCYHVSPTNAAESASVWLMERGVARPAAALGSANEWPKAVEALQGKPPLAARLPAGVSQGDRLTFAWSDLTGDGRVQPHEVTFIKGDCYGVTVMPDLAFVVSYLDGKAVRFAPVGFTPRGVPRYDLSRGTVLVKGTRKPWTSGGGQALAGEGGWTILTVPPEPYPGQSSMAGVRNGEPMWSYPSLWPGLHPSHDAPMPSHPGQLLGTTRLLGGLVKPRGSDAGQLWAINGNKGNAYLFTTDGLFVATLFRDCRVASWSAPQAVRGMLVDDLSQNEECFWPSMTQTRDGRIYLVTGGHGGSIVRVEGLEGIRRLPDQEIAVTPEQIRAAQEWRLQQEAARQTAEGPRTLVVHIRTQAPTVDGKLDDWPEAAFVPVDARAAAAVAVAGDRLYAAFKTGDANLLANAGTSKELLFKTGGALDVMIGAVPEGERLLVTRVQGQMTAMLYRPRDPEARTQPTLFTSPLRTVRFDRVEDVSAEVVLAAGGDGVYEFSVPLGLLDMRPAPGQTMAGDIGLLRGNGFQTLQRAYWHNKATGITADIPSEAELTPKLWGVWRFEAAP